ncbi:sensor histidine kinase [Streptomyces coffeae]|uniref:histidine kinase n=1 Tax=Streptomyces coffeae TaxID=621382 RepID=A0ABS1N6F3_9ACTN|nr:histidine kinase [Streptomyces coffeae]MBL1095657.1 two-component sensor histidine kinase [Streptomyces coffeae]
MPSRPRLLQRPHRDDVLISLSGLVGGVIMWSLGLVGGEKFPRDPEALTLLPLVVMAAAELLRRTAPAVALCVAVPALVGDQLLGSLIATLAMFTDVLYAAVVYGTPAMARKIPLGTVCLTVVATVVPIAVYRTSVSLLIGIAVGLVLLTPAWTGWGIREHREAAAAERLRAEQTALLAELDRREAVTAERARMARELHDMVANHLSAIAIHSTAALSLKDTAATEQALGVIRENSVRGLAEMRRLIGLLRDAGDEAAPGPAPTLDALDALLEQARTTAAAGSGGQEFLLRDERPEGAAPLPAPVELAAYRIVQESLTNALKHAGPGRVDVTLARLPDGPLEVGVTSPCGEDRPAPRAPGSGSGLIGMRERVSLLGGTLEAGPADGPPGTVWRVRATLPLKPENTDPTGNTPHPPIDREPQ